MIRQPGQGDTLQVLSDQAAVLIAGNDSHGAVSLVELVLAAGSSIAPHSHPGSDEALYVLEGRCALSLNEATHELDPGACAFVPGGVVHAVLNRSNAAARLLSISIPPAGSERTFLELAAGFATGPDGSAALAQAVGLLGVRRGLGLSPEASASALTKADREP